MSQWRIDTRYVKHRWVRPRVRALGARLLCALTHHPWGRWRRETEDWFEYVDWAAPWAWRACPRCHCLQHVLPMRYTGT